jgi:cupin fold WbuC family metalloprotein
MNASVTTNLGGLEVIVDARGRSEALYCAGPAVVDSKVIAALKERMRAASAPTARICLHKDSSASVHDMIIAHQKGAPTPMHKHLVKEETYQMIEGRLRLDFFSEEGALTHSVTLSEPGTGLPFLARVRPGLWHATVPETEFAIFHESRPGPFDGTDSIYRDEK